MTHKQPVTRILRKSTPALIAAVIAVGLLAGASRGLAVTMTWTNGSDLWTSTTAWTTNQSTAYTNEVIGVVTNQVTNSLCVATLPPNSTVVTNCVGGTGGNPSLGDQALFTNNTSYTVTVGASTNLGVLTVSSTAGVVTIDGSGSTLTVTGRVRIANGGDTSTVVWAGGTLTVATGPNSTTEIASSATTTNAVGTLIVTNGTAIVERNVSMGGAPGSIGKLVISGPGIVTNSPGMSVAANFIFRARTIGSQIIITNGGKLFWPGRTRVESNSVMLVSGPNSLLSCTNTPGVTETLSIGMSEQLGRCSLIVSNGATVRSEGTISIGRGGANPGDFSPFNTGVVVGAGSKLIVGTGNNISDITHLIIGSGSVGGSQYNNLTVYDGGYLECGGPFFSIPNAALCTNNSFNMGGVGAMSTGTAFAVRNNTAAVNSPVVVSNAVFTCTSISVNGIGGNTLQVLSKGTLNVTRPSPLTTNLVNSVSVSAVSGMLTIDGGTLNAVSGTNGTTVTVGGSGTLTGNSLIITNGGNLLADNVNVNSTSSIIFTSGTLSTGGMGITSGANGSNVFVVGDGTSVAYYDMASGGSGYHVFGSPGFVVTNNAFLRGSGTLRGTTRILGTFVPGFAGAVGSVLSSNSITFGSSAVLNYDLGTNSDSVTIGTNTTLFLRGTLNVQNSGGFTATNYTLFTLLTDTTLTTNDLTVGTLPPGYTAVVSNDVPNGKVLLVVTATGGGDPYSAWLTSYGLTGGNALGTADPDGDGVSNTNEFLAGFNPTNSAAYAHVINIVKSGADMSITYLGANGDSTWSPGIGSRTNVLEFSTGTANGSYTNNFASTGQTNVLNGGTGSGIVTNMVDVGGGTNVPSRYYRIRVLTP